MLTKTYPYGMKKMVRIERIDKSSSGPIVTCIEKTAAGDEGWILAGTAHDIPLKPGMYAEMTFMQGGPTGGYWKLTNEV